MHNILAVQRVLRCHAVDRFLHAQAVRVVDELCRHARFLHLLQLPAVLPSVRPRPVAQRIANRIIGNGVPVDRRELVASPQVLGSVSIQLFHQATSCAFRYIAQSIECFPFYCKYIFVKVGWLILEFHSSTRCVTGILNLVWRDFCPRHCQIRKSCTFPPARHF